MRNFLFSIFCIINLSLFAQIPSYVPTNGLEGWWPFNGNANDESGNGNHGTVNGATLTADRNGNVNSAYNFSVSNNTIDFGNNPILGLTSSQIKTFSFWMKCNSSSYLSIYKYDNGNAGNSNYAILGGINSISSTGNGTGANTTYNGILSNVWTHVLFIIQSGTNNTKIYINGVLASTGTSNLLSTVSSANLKINLALGIQNYTTGTGYFDDFSIWNRALTQQEITAVYQGCNTPIVSITPKSKTDLLENESVVLSASRGSEYTYKWYKDGVLIDNEIDSNFTATVPGFYTVKVSTSANCNSTSEGVTVKRVYLTPNYLPTNGLVGWWPFNGNANDESGNGNNGTVNGATLTADRNGSVNSAYNFDGFFSNIKVVNNNSINVNSLTISGWMNASQLGGVRGLVSRWNQLNNPCANYSASIDNLSNNFVGACSKYTNTVLYSSSSVNLNIWYHFVYKHDSQKGGELYLNSELVASNNLIGDICTSNNDLYFGAQINNTNLWRFFSGKLDDIAIYNRALTQQEITALYQSCTNPTASITPQSNTSFCQGNSVVLNASTGTNYTYEWYKDGTIINGATTSSYSALTAGSYTVKVIDGSCNATSSATTLTLIDTLTWTGNVDNDWHKPCNWSPAVVPECCNSVKIPFTTNSPVISGVAKAKNVNVYSTSGASLTVNNGANLQIETCPLAKTENSCPVLPVLTTTVISNTTQTTAQSGGNITYTGSSNIIARGVCWSTSTAPTIANSKTTDGSGTGSFTSNLTGLIAGTTYYVRAYATNASGTNYGNEVSFISQPAYPIGTVFCNGKVTYVKDVTNPTTGKIWMDRNLGASQVAISKTDNLAYGDLYQWGRNADGHHCRNSSTSNVLSSESTTSSGVFIYSPNTPSDWLSVANNNLWQGVNGLNNPCPNGYRLPTESELFNERATWISKNDVGAFDSPLKWTIAGVRAFENATVFSVGFAGQYWTSTISGNQSIMIDFYHSGATIAAKKRANGISVRCIKN
jgi:hypothetical protein